MRTASFILIALGVLVFGAWAVLGAEPVTKYQIPHETTLVDEFGDEVTSTEMVDGFRFGLLPDQYILDGALPLGGLLLASGVVLFVVARRRRPEKIVVIEK